MHSFGGCERDGTQCSDRGAIPPSLMLYFTTLSTLGPARSSVNQDHISEEDQRYS